MVKETEILIVGFGIAGACLSCILSDKRVDHLVMDSKSEFSATVAAAGIINPITGRRFVKTWMADQIIPYASDFYDLLGNRLNGELIKQCRIIRIFSSIKEENAWYGRIGDPAYQQYMIEESDIESYEDIIVPGEGIGEVKGYQVNLQSLLSKYSLHLARKEQMINEKFDYNLIEIQGDKIKYGDIVCSKIIFCEGYQAIYNPFFNFLPFEPATGDVLIIKIPGLKSEKILKRKIFIAPFQEPEIFWVGSTYDWDVTDISKKESKKLELIKEINKTITCDFEIIEHIVGVRPTVKDRRPLLGRHPEKENLFLFNGLGTKGSSLAPYWANELCKFILNKEPLHKEVDLLRYWS